LAIKIPGRTASFSLGIAAILTVVFPILSLPCSITGFSQAKMAKKFIESNNMKNDSIVNFAFYLNLFAILCTAAIMVYAIPGAIERNFIR
jgi:hypothetical protein